MKKIQYAFWILFGFGVIGYMIYKIAMNSFTEHFLGSHPKRIKAVIINDKNYMGNHSQVFTYSYQFVVNGEKYIGNSHDKGITIGDSVDVIYNADHPNINKALNPKD
jgi:hypothetical protein